MVLGYAESLEAIRTLPEYQRDVKRNLPHFPPIDCPEEYKEALSGLCTGMEIGEFLDTRIPAYKKTARELLESKQYETIEKMITLRVQIDLVGTGSL